MKKFADYQSTLELYAEIQKHVYSLRSKSTDEEVNKLFKIIPPNFYDEKDNLIMLCQLFAMNGRYDRQMGRITIKLFERIIDYIKRDLQNEPSLMWDVFGSCCYFKFWLYKEGLIDIEQICQSAQTEQFSSTAEYFLPEIIEYNPDFFHKEIKTKFACFSSESSYSKQTIENLKNLREKHLKWLKESNNFHDEIYKEIETDPIRLAIKTDDISTFQFLLSRTNSSIDSSISESVIEHFLRYNVDIHYIDFAAKYNAINIFNFLLINGAEISSTILNFVEHWDNYDMIHAIESKLNLMFVDDGMRFSIQSWNEDFINYIIETYDFDFLIENEEEEEECNDDINENLTNNEMQNAKNEIKDNENEVIENKNDENKDIENKNDENKDIENKDIENKNDENKDIENKNDENKDIENKDIENKNDENKDIENKDIENKDIENKDIENKDIENKDIENKNDENKDIENKDIENKNDENKDIENKNDENKDKKKKFVKQKEFDAFSVLEIFNETVYSYNMNFLNSILLPFLLREKYIVQFSFQRFIEVAYQDMSSFCAELILNFPTIRTDVVLENMTSRLLFDAINSNNTRIIEKLINNEKFTDNINEFVFHACASLASMQVIKIFCNHKDFDINYVNKNKISVIHISLVRGHYFALKYFFETYKNIKDFDLTDEIIYPIRNDHLMSLKCYIEYLMNKYDSDKFQEIINGYKMHYKKKSENVIYMLDQLIDEIKSEKM